MVGVHAGAATDVGRVREVNEDAVLVGEWLFAIADGMGGQAAGEVASRLVVESLARGDCASLSGDSVRQLILDASVAIGDYGRTNPDSHGLGTTVAGFAVIPGPSNLLAVFHVGDSRVYRLNERCLERLTTDHSEVTEFLEAGHVSPEEARHHPSRHVLTRAIVEELPPQPEIRMVPAGPGDRWMIASDGLTGEVEEAEMEAILRRHASPQECADALVSAALAAGGHDNVSVVVADLAFGDDYHGDLAVTAPRAVRRQNEEHQS